MPHFTMHETLLFHGSLYQNSVDELTLREKDFHWFNSDKKFHYWTITPSFFQPIPDKLLMVTIWKVIA